MNKEFIRMQKLAGLMTEGLYTSDEKAPMEAMSHSKMTKKELKEKIKEMMLSDDVTEGADKMYYHVLEDVGGEIGHQGYYDTKEEAQERADKLADLFPRSFFYVEASNSKAEPSNVTLEGETPGEMAYAEMGSLDEASLDSFPTDIDWEVVGRDMDGLSLEGYSETTNKYYTGAIGGSYDPDTDPNPEFSNEDLLFIEEIPFNHLSPIQKHLLSKGNMDEDLFEAKKEEESDTEDVIVADTEEVPAEDTAVDVTADDTQVDVNMDGVPDVDTGSAESKKAFTSLVDTYNASKELGDPKLTQMIANALTYYNKNIILKAGQPQA